MLHIKGIDAAISKLKAVELKADPAVMRGLIETAILVRRDTEKTPPITPLDLGNLRASFFTTTSMGQTSSSGNFKGAEGAKVQKDTQQAITKASGEAHAKRQPTLILGYGANYAVYVHERTEQKFKRPSSGPKWFQLALERNAAAMLKTIKSSLKL